MLPLTDGWTAGAEGKTVGQNSVVAVITNFNVEKTLRLEMLLENVFSQTYKSCYSLAILK